MIEAVLRYYDRIAGMQFTKDMNHKRELVSKMSMLQEEEYTFAKILAKCNLMIDKEPTHVKAKVLQAPTVRFKGATAKTTNGSFRLMNVTFGK